MDEQILLDIRLQMESLICEREAMIVFNKEQEHRGEPLGYSEHSFQALAASFTALVTALRR